MKSLPSYLRTPLPDTITRRFLEAFDRHKNVTVLITIALLTILAWINRFIQDDAFISFRYAEHLINGHGLVWNIGERVEGYTNFLWVILIAGGMQIGIEPVLFSYILGLCFFPVTLYFFFLLCRIVLKSDAIAYLGLLLLGTNYTFSIYATGGLETHFLTLLLVAITTITAHNFKTNTWNPRSLLALSLLIACALLTRLDSAIPCGIAVAFILAHFLKNSPDGNFIRRLLLLCLPAVIIVTTWLTWKLNYYGTILPNTFYAKMEFGSSLPVGLRYLHRFSLSYFLYPVICVALFSFRYFFRTASITLWMIAIQVLTWIAYVAVAGGDFMEFRFMVTITPLLFIIILWVLYIFFRNVPLRILLTCVIVGGTIHHTLTFAYDSHYEIESRAMLHGHLYNDNEQWINVGKMLEKAFQDVPGITVAVTTGGAIPFYSGLTCIDMLGLNDTFVPRNGMFLSTRPGHHWIAPLSYLQQRKVNIVISHPTVVPLETPPTITPYLPRYPDEALPDARLIEIPLDAKYKIFVWYLNPTPEINSIIQQHRWKAFRNTMYAK